MISNDQWFSLISSELFLSLNPKILLELDDRTGGILGLSERSLKEIAGFNEKQTDYIVNHMNDPAILRAYEKMHELAIRMVLYTDEAYPEALRHLYDPPMALFVKGQLPREDEWMISIVGARRSTDYGQQIAKMFGRGLAKAGISIVSGMARGIDSAAHFGALEGAGKTYAVLGCGTDICYPKDNMDLYEEVIENGGLISEYPPGAQPIGWRFPRRNRIIAGLSKGILVVEAAQHSGSLITANQALEQGKDIFVIPGRITDPRSEGCLNLIRQGGKLVMSPEDILKEYGIKAKKYRKDLPDLSALEMAVYQCLDLVPKTPEEIMRLSGIKPAHVMTGLIGLEIKDLVRTVGKNQFIVTL